MSTLMKRLEALEADAGTSCNMPLVLHTNDDTGLLFRHAHGAKDAGPGRDQMAGEDRDTYLAEMNAAFDPIIFVIYEDPPPRLDD